jgi:hypothetical protein
MIPHLYKKEMFMKAAQENIQARAYDFFVNRTGNGGSQLEDWLKAEKEIGQESVDTQNNKGRHQKKPLSTGTSR